MIVAQAVLLSLAVIAQAEPPGPSAAVQELLRSKEACTILSEVFEGHPPRASAYKSQIITSKALTISYQVSTKSQTLAYQRLAKSVRWPWGCVSLLEYPPKPS